MFYFLVFPLVNPLYLPGPTGTGPPPPVEEDGPPPVLELIEEDGPTFIVLVGILIPKINDGILIILLLYPKI
jgi:hypothetical protein